MDWGPTAKPVSPPPCGCQNNKPSLVDPSCQLAKILLLELPFKGAVNNLQARLAGIKRSALTRPFKVQPAGTSPTRAVPPDVDCNTNSRLLLAPSKSTVPGVPVKVISDVGLTEAFEIKVFVPAFEKAMLL